MSFFSGGIALPDDHTPVNFSLVIICQANNFFYELLLLLGYALKSSKKNNMFQFEFLSLL